MRIVRVLALTAGDGLGIGSPRHRTLVAHGGLLEHSIAHPVYPWGPNRKVGPRAALTAGGRGTERNQPSHAR